MIHKDDNFKYYTHGACMHRSGEIGIHRNGKPYRTYEDAILHEYEMSINDISTYDNGALCTMEYNDGVIIGSRPVKPATHDKYTVQIIQFHCEDAEDDTALPDHIYYMPCSRSTRYVNHKQYSFGNSYDFNIKGLKI